VVVFAMISVPIENARSFRGTCTLKAASWVAMSLVMVAQLACSGESEAKRLGVGDAFARCVTLRQASYLEHGAKEGASAGSFERVLEAEQIAQSVSIWVSPEGLDVAAENWRRRLLEATSTAEQAKRLAHCDRTLVCAPMQLNSAGLGPLAGAGSEVQAQAGALRACARELRALGAFREQVQNSVEGILSSGDLAPLHSIAEVLPLLLPEGPTGLDSPSLGGLRITESAIFRAWVGFDPKRCPDATSKDPRECEGLVLESVTWSGEQASRRLDRPEGLIVWQDLTIDEQGQVIAYSTCRPSKKDPVATCMLRQGMGGAGESVALNLRIRSEQKEALRDGTVSLDELAPKAPKWAVTALSSFSRVIPEVAISADSGDVKWREEGEIAWTPRVGDPQKGRRFAIISRQGTLLLLREGPLAERSARLVRLPEESIVGARLRVLSPSRLAITGGPRRAGLPAWVVISDDAGETWAGR